MGLNTPDQILDVIKGVIYVLLALALGWIWTKPRLPSSPPIRRLTREQLLEPPLRDEPPRCPRCGRAFIWPNHEPVPPRQRCRDCITSKRIELIWTAVFSLALTFFFWGLARLMR